MKSREAMALELTRRVLDWARSAYAWECFWDEMNWSPPSPFAENKLTLRMFIRQFEELYPELRSNDQPIRP
jgi:hypothetical protein